MIMIGIPETNALKNQCVSAMSNVYTMKYVIKQLADAGVEETFHIKEWSISSLGEVISTAEPCDAKDDDIIYAYFMWNMLDVDHKYKYKRLLVIEAIDIIAKTIKLNEDNMYVFSFNVNSKGKAGEETWIDINQLYDVVFGDKTYHVDRNNNHIPESQSKYKSVSTDITDTTKNDIIREYIDMYIKSNHIKDIISFEWVAEVSNSKPEYIQGIISHKLEEVSIDDLILSYKIWSILSPAVKEKCKYIILLDQTKIDVSCDQEDYLLSLYDPGFRRYNWIVPEEMYLAVDKCIQDIKKETETIELNDDSIKAWAFNRNIKYVEVIFSRTGKEAIYTASYIHPNDAFKLNPCDFILSTILFKDNIYPKYDTVILLHASGISVEVDDKDMLQFTYQYGTARISGVDHMYSYMMDLIDKYNGEGENGC